MRQIIQHWIENSVFVNTIKTVYYGYRTFEDRLDGIYSYSIFHRMLAGIRIWICIAFRFSIFGRLTEIGEGEPIPVFETSRVANKVLGIYNRFVERITEYSRESVFVISGLDIGNSFQQKPLKTGGVILVTAVPINLLLIFITGNDVGYLGIGMRIVLFLLGLAGLYSDTDLETLKEGSVFIKKIEQKT